MYTSILGLPCSSNVDSHEVKYLYPSLVFCTTGESMLTTSSWVGIQFQIVYDMLVDTPKFH